MAQTKTEIRSILESAGLKPQKRWGQNFLIDGNLMRKLLEAAEITDKTVVLEVGAGTGSLTEMLLEHAGWVVGVELDRGLYDVLKQRLRSQPRLTLLQGDVLQSKSQISPEILAALKQTIQPLVGNEQSQLMLVSNLPYNIATPLLLSLLVCELNFSRFCFSVQKEVAEKILSAHGRKSYGPMSIVLQSTCSMEKIVNLPPQVFWPKPAVDSVILRLDPDLSNFDNLDHLRAFMRFVRAGFGHRRKTLHYFLKAHYASDQWNQACTASEINPQDRPEALSVEQWLRLFFALNPL